MIGALALSLCALLPGYDGGEVARTVFIVAHNSSADPALQPLRYADDDGLLWAKALQPWATRTVLLSALDDETQASRAHGSADGLRIEHPDRASLQQALLRVKSGLADDRRRDKRTELFFIYVGHGSLDENGRGALHLADGLWRREEVFRDVIDGLSADVTHVILDACHAWSVVAGRGEDQAGQGRSDFAGELSQFLGGNDLDERPTVGVLLASSDSRETHEWSRIRQGLFSHQLRSALSGAADVNGDGKLEYSEVAAFVDAANAGIAVQAARLATFAWPPRFDRRVAVLDLSAAGPSRRLMILDEALAGRFFIEDDAGQRLVALHKAAGTPLVLAVPAADKLFVRGTARERMVPPGRRPIRIRHLEAELSVATRGAVDSAFDQQLFAVPYGDAYYRGFLSGRAQLLPVDDQAPRLQVAAEGDDLPVRVEGGYAVGTFLLDDPLQAPAFEHGGFLSLAWTGWPVAVGLELQGAFSPVVRGRVQGATRGAALLRVAGHLPVSEWLRLRAALGSGVGFLALHAGERSSLDPSVPVAAAGVGLEVHLTPHWALTVDVIGSGAVVSTDGVEALRLQPQLRLGGTFGP